MNTALCRCLLSFLLAAPALLSFTETAKANEAQEEKIDVYIPSQKLAEALFDFSSAFNRVVVGLPSVLEHHQSVEVSGFFQAREALLLMLSNTDLQVYANDGSGFVIVQAEKADAENAASIPKADSTNDVSENEREIENVYVLGRPALWRPVSTSATVQSLAADYFINHQVDAIELISKKITSMVAPLDFEGTMVLNMRGLGNKAGFVWDTEPIMMHYNGIHKPPTLASGLILFDITGADIYKGPQLTEAGRSSLGGSMYLKTAPAVLADHQTTVKLTLGNYAHKSQNVMLNLPVGDEFAIRGAAVHSARDAYIDTWQNYQQLSRDPNSPVLNYPVDLSFRVGQVDTPSLYDGYENRDQYAWRVSSLWQPDEWFSWAASIEAHNKNNTGSVPLDPYVVENYGRAVVVDSPGVQHTDNVLLNSSTHYAFSGLSFHHQFGLSENSLRYNSDFDLGRLGYFVEYRIPLHKYRTINHNVELYTNAHEHRLQWLVGGYCEDTAMERRAETDNFFNPDFRQGWVLLEPKTKNQHRDIYARMNMPLAKSMELTLGTRFVYHRQSVERSRSFECSTNILRPMSGGLSGQLPEALLDHDTLVGSVLNIGNDHSCTLLSYIDTTESWKKTLYQLGVNYDLNTNYQLYSDFSTGYRAGLIQANERHALPNPSRNIELGVRAKLLDNKLSFNASVFRNSVDNIKEYSWWIDGVAQDGSATAFYNRVDTTHQGLDMNMSYVGAQDARLDFGFSYLDATFDQHHAIDYFFPDNVWNPPAKDVSLARQGFSDLAGNYVPNAPELSASVQYEHPIVLNNGSLTPLISVNMTGPYYLDVFNRRDYVFSNAESGQSIPVKDISRQPSTTIIDSSLTWRSARNTYTMTLFANNLTNELVRSGISLESFVSLRGFSSHYLPPRTFGLSLLIKIQ